ncbi:RluA family pseudouridine synthase [Treponema parvum]|uniref:RluA family pseudouridine synthase n=1 Tax=Treponema parvum TaxID=138851 RepID=A0A975F3G7_9SPIR|nr:RluA family pseudouridine synthase [Treponema parvum]QTQ13643.1 RluA family pseudouridine synthase [Treponema parvum]
MNFVPILYENEDIMVIEKPSGMSCQGGHKIFHPLDEELSKQVGYKVYLVHRLDRDTAGLMVVAKSSAAAGRWIKLIGGKQVQKEYKAVCIGTPSGGISGTITEPVSKGGIEKPAVTGYRVEKIFTFQDSDKAFAEGRRDFNTEISLLHLKLGTGRMHQIRIHLAKIGCPIVGDDKYGDFKLNKYLKKTAGVRRLMLACVHLTLPIAGKQKKFEIPEPLYFSDFLKTCSPRSGSTD